MTIDTFFDKGYYINLKSRPDRDFQITQELNNIGLLNFFERHTAFVPSLDDVNKDNTAEIYGRKVGACAQSHIDIIKKASSLNLKNVLILEDDATFFNSGDIPAIDLINSGLDTLHTINDWDIVYLGGIIVEPKVKKVGKNLLQVDRLLSSHAWGINKKMFKYFLNFTPYLDYSCAPVGAMDAAFGNHTRLKKYLIHPLAVYQRIGTLSDIDINAKANVTLSYEQGISSWLNNYTNIILK